MAITEITSDNFQSEVLDRKGKVLLDFWAPWCGPCRSFSPVVDQYADAHPEVHVGKVNIDEQPELARQFGVMSIPTAVVMEDGQAVKGVSGAMMLPQLESWVEAEG